MAIDVYISPSSQPANTYAAGKTNEQEQCRRIAMALVKALERCGISSVVNTADGSTMYDRVRESNAMGAKLHLPIHTNAFNGKLQGTRLFCSSKTGKGGQACKDILAELAPVVPGESDGIQTAQFYEITDTLAPCAYVEVAFHDNKAQALWIIENTDAISEALCKGLCAYFGKLYIPPIVDVIDEEKPPVEPETAKIIRVQVGAFYNRHYAVALRDELISKGYNAFIVE